MVQINQSIVNCTWGIQFPLNQYHLLTRCDCYLLSRTSSDTMHGRNYKQQAPKRLRGPKAKLEMQREYWVNNKHTGPESGSVVQPLPTHTHIHCELTVQCSKDTLKLKWYIRNLIKFTLKSSEIRSPITTNQQQNIVWGKESDCPSFQPPPWAHCLGSAKKEGREREKWVTVVMISRWGESKYWKFLRILSHRDSCLSYLGLYSYCVAAVWERKRSQFPMLSYYSTFVTANESILMHHSLDFSTISLFLSQDPTQNTM